MLSLYRGTQERIPLSEALKEGNVVYGLFAPWCGYCQGNYGSFATVEEAVEEAYRQGLPQKGYQTIEIHAQYRGWGFPECCVAKVLPVKE